MIVVRTLLCGRLSRSFLRIHSLKSERASPRKLPSHPRPTRRTMKVAKGFKVELLYSVPKDEQGSWVNMCVDPKGRLIVSDQYGALYRVTPPAVGGQGGHARSRRSRPRSARPRGCSGRSTLYVVVNAGRVERPLPRHDHRRTTTRSTRSSCSARFEGGGGEHGPHAVLLHPGRQAAHGRLRRPDEDHRSTTRHACRRSGARITCCRACPTATAS